MIQPARPSGSSRPAIGHLWPAVLALLAGVGCGAQPSRVTGKVTFDGQPLPAGRVTFLCDGQGRPAITAAITETGAYEIAHAPVGRARLSVQTFKPRSKPAPILHPVTGALIPDEFAETGPYVAIPDRYRSPQDSGLECTIVPGPQTFDIVLEK